MLAGSGAEAVAVIVVRSAASVCGAFQDPPPNSNMVQDGGEFAARAQRMPH